MWEDVVLHGESGAVTPHVIVRIKRDKLLCKCSGTRNVRDQYGQTPQILCGTNT